MSDEPTITLWLFIPPSQTFFQFEGKIIAPMICPKQYTLEEIAFHFNFPEEVTTMYFPTKEQAEEYLANYTMPAWTQEDSE